MDGTTRRRSPGRKGTPQAEPKSKLPQTVAEVLHQHVVLETESIDRMYLNVIVGRLQIRKLRCTSSGSKRKPRSCPPTLWSR